MTAQSILKAVEPHDHNDAVLAEILAINSALSDLQGRVSRLAQQMVTRQATIPSETDLEGILNAVSEALSAPEEASCSVPATPEGSVVTENEADSAPLPLKHYEPQSPACQKVLDLYGDTTLTPAEISRRLGMNRSSVGSYLAMGRKAKDPRVVKGDAARRSAAPAAAEAGADLEAEEIVETVIVQVDEPFAPSRHEVPEEVSAGLSSLRVFPRVPRYSEDDDASPARLRLPSIPAAPKAKVVETYNEEPRREPATDFDPSKIMVVDVEASQIHGPLGVLEVARPFARSMERMADGGTYDVDTLRDLGPWPRTDAMKGHFSVMRSKLASIGIDLVTVNKFMFRVRRLEA